MAKYDEGYEPATVRLLADHLEQDVPDDVDIWPVVNKRLAEHELSQDGTQAPGRHWWLRNLHDTVVGHKPSAESYTQNAVGTRRFALSAISAIGLIGVLALAALAIGSLSRHADVNVVKPSPQNGQPSGDNTRLFSIQTGGDIFTTNYTSGFGVGDDSSFWLGMGDGRIAHYSHSGQLLATLNLSDSIKGYYDLEAQGTMLWVAYGETVYKVSQDGSILASYRPQTDMIPMTSIPLIYQFILRAGGDGQMLAEVGGGQYLKVANQTLGPDGKPDPPPLPGYPANGKLYMQGQSPDEIMAGDVRVTIDVTATTGLTQGEPIAWHILSVLKDGSFYVELELRTPEFGAPSSYIFVLHYASGGKLIERARVSTPGQFTVNEKQIAMGPDGAFYAVGLTTLQSNGPYLGGRIDVVRLNFYPASQPLPPVLTPIPTPVLPTEIPTIERQIPAPLPTGPEAEFATWAPEPTATLQPTPIADLATLAGKAEVIAHVQLRQMEPWNSEVLPFDAKIVEWIKRPSDLVTGNLNVDEFLGPNGEIKVAPALREIPDIGEEEFVVFLNRNPINYGNVQNYEFTDPISGVYRISNGKIDYAGISMFHGWTIDQFNEALRPLVPTPEPVEQSVQDLVELGRQSTIVEVQFAPTTWQQSETLPDGSVLVMAKVVNWLRKAGATDLEYVGLIAAHGDSTRLQSGSGHFILFVGPYSSDNNCEDSQLYGYYQIQQQPKGIFEILDATIGYAGIPGVEGWDVAKLDDTLSRYVPAPQGDSPQSPPDIAGDVGSAEMIAEVEIGTSHGSIQPTIAPQSNFDLGKPQPVVFSVRKWLKKPSSYTGDTIKIAIDDMGACSMFTKSDYYIIFLFRKTPFPKGSPLEGAYEPFGGFDGIYGIHNGIIVFGGIAKYLGWTVDRFENEIQGLLQSGTLPEPTASSK